MNEILSLVSTCMFDSLTENLFFNFCPEAITFPVRHLLLLEVTQGHCISRNACHEMNIMYPIDVSYMGHEITNLDILTLY